MIIEIKNQKFFHEQSFNFELNNELLKTDINDAELKESDEIFWKFLINIFQKNKNILEPIILIILKKLFRKESYTGVDIVPNY